MPRLTIWTLRCALVHLGLGAAIGGLLLVAKGLGLLPAIWHLRTLHIHMMLLGWTAQFAWGVAFWIMPRLSGAGDRGSPRLAWLATALLNLGAAAVALDGAL
ncbi:MAG TPA: hypothetical protein VGE07_05105, partial [Herpetosiphonaceae bacterium]